MRILKLFAVLSFILVGFPLVFTFDTAGFDNISAFRITAYFLIGFAVAYVGYASVMLSGKIRKHRARNAVRKIVLLTLGAAVAVLSAVVASILSFDPGLCFALSLFYLLCYGVGAYSCRRNYSEIFPIGWLGGYVVEMAILYLSFGAFVREELVSDGRSVLMASFIIQCAFCSILVNQTNILVQASRRSETKGMIPKNMRRYNLLLISFVSVFLLSAYLFRDFIAEVIKLAVQGIWTVIMFLLDLLPFQTVDNTSDVNMDAKPDIMFINEGTDYSMIIVLIILAVLAFLLRKKIYKAICGLIRKIYEMFTKGKPQNDEYEEEYLDEYESVSETNERRMRPLTLKKVLREYSSEKDKARKFRLGYKAYLLWIKGYRIELNASDTAGIHKRKGEKLNSDLELFEDIERYYNEIRYDSKISDEACERMAELIAIIER